MSIFKSLYLTSRFFYWIASVVFMLIASYIFPATDPLPYLLLWVGMALFIRDFFLLYLKNGSISANRFVPEMLSNGDKNQISIRIKNNYKHTVKINIIDEIPHIFQVRDFNLSQLIAANTQQVFSYTLTPVKRGDYLFGWLNIYVHSHLGLIKRRFIFNNEAAAIVYPSIIQMKAFAMYAQPNRHAMEGLRKVRRLGHTMEFEHIRQYVHGDDVRSINWKATARKSQLMVNQYQDEKAQHIYSVIDMSRTMKMPFQGLSLVDWAINSSLALSNIIIKKDDKAGLITYSNIINTTLAASNRAGQMQRILQALYNQKSQFPEGDSEALYAHIRQIIKQRSLLLFYTNFESLSALHRHLPVLKKLNQHHRIILIMFRNSTLHSYTNQAAEDEMGAYKKTIARKMIYEKEQIAAELKKHGIQSLLVYPEELTVEVINTYLEIKAKHNI